MVDERDGTEARLRNQQLASMAKSLSLLFPRVMGTFTLAAAATLVVPQTATQSLSLIFLMPTNAGAGTLMGSTRSLYVSARTQGASFTVATASGAAATGGETFSYVMFSPV